VFGTGKQLAWSQAHRWWLGQQQFERTAERVMFEDYLLGVEQTEARRRSLELHLEDLAREPRYAEAVGWLRCFRGIDTITAITLIAELHDFRRFRSPSQYGDGRAISVTGKPAISLRAAEARFCNARS
jgi:hypothetical protein